MVYQDPLHYLLGIEGLALLRTYAGEHGPEFGEARVAEIRRLLDSALPQGVEAARVDTTAGYRVWSETYDEPGNGLFPVEEPFVHEIVDALPAGVALDAACGTGRHAAHLAARGHRVIGVDSSPEMLARARERVPAGDFRAGELDRLPLPDAHVDVAVCALALAHLSDLRPAFAELARVVRPGGHLIVTDIHHEMVLLGSEPHHRTAAGAPQIIPSYRHRAADYLDAALPAGLAVRRCAEPRSTPAEVTAGLAERLTTGPWELWPWTLMELAPAAVAAASAGVPSVILWHFQRSGSVTVVS
ncbi:class I SAM-dependent methyltransferase [Actinoplanes sp. NPDC026619]|uniref:class I SAM-dependent methyltransferase n=1 Tax=Actinoplanes sp. NPDC026619 TaxID=3155798 RepID=UPI003409C3FE